MFYIGKVVMISKTGKFGYIDHHSLSNQFGKPVKLDTKKDIYIHQDESASMILMGRKFQFEVVTDPKRVNAFRATRITRWVEVSPWHEWPIFTKCSAAFFAILVAYFFSVVIVQMALNMRLPVLGNSYSDYGEGIFLSVLMYVTVAGVIGASIGVFINELLCRAALFAYRLVVTGN